MAGWGGSKANRSDMADTIGRMIDERIGRTFTALPGRIRSFDPATQRATVEVLHTPQVGGEALAIPDLVEVPVSQPRGGGFAITLPLKAGDGVQILFQSGDTDRWYQEGGRQDGATRRTSDLSFAVAVPGLEPAPNALESYDPDNLVIGTTNGGVTVSPDGKVSIEGGGEDLLTILHDLLTILEGGQTTVTYGSSAGIHPLTQQADYGALKGRLAAMKLR